MEQSTINVPDARPSCGRPPVDLRNPALVAEWLAETRAALSMLTHAARDACSRERVYSRSELRRRVKKADRLMRCLLSGPDSTLPPVRESTNSLSLVSANIGDRGRCVVTHRRNASPRHVSVRLKPETVARIDALADEDHSGGLSTQPFAGVACGDPCGTRALRSPHEDCLGQRD